MKKTGSSLCFHLHFNRGRDNDKEGMTGMNLIKHSYRLGLGIKGLSQSIHMSFEKDSGEQG